AAPRLAAVSGLVQPAFRSSVNQRPGVTAALVGDREHHVGIVRIEGDVADAGVLADLQDLVPGRPAVDRLVESSLSTLFPQRSVRGDEHYLRVARVDHDTANLLGRLQAEIPPRLPGIVAAIDAVSVADGA